MQDNQYPHFDDLIYSINLDQLITLERFIVSLADEDKFGVKENEFVPKYVALSMLNKAKKDYIAKHHVDISYFDRAISNKATDSEQKEYFLHISLCKQCFDESKRYKSLYYNQFQKAMYMMEFGTNSSDKPSSEDEQIDAKQPALEIATHRDFVNGQVVFKIQKVQTADESKKDSTAIKKGVNHYMKIAAAVILALQLAGFSFYGGYRYQKAEVVKEVQSTRSANTETDAVKLAKIFEDASKRIESNSNDSVAYLIRATAAKKLMLLDQAVEDYKAYCALTDSSCERELEIIEKIKSLKVEKTSYDLIDENIDQYLTSLMKYDNAAAQSYLAEASLLADAMLKKTGDRFGVDLVSYYRNLSVEKAGILLEARKIRSQIDKTPALDNFSEYIPRLERVKAIFKQNSATVEAAYNATVLSRFYLKAFKHDESKKEVDEFLKLSTDAGYKLCQAGLLWIDSQLAYTKGDTPNLISLNDKSVKLYSQIDCGNLNLAPLMVGIDYQVNITSSDTLAFSNALEGLAKSLKQEEGNKRLAAFAARFARFQTITAHKMDMPQLAEHYIRQAISIAELHNLITYRVEYYCILSALHAEQGNKEVSLELLNKAVTFASTDLAAQKDIEMIINAYKGKIYGVLKDYQASEAAYKEALKLVTELKINELIYTAEIRKGLGEALCMQGRKVDAKTELVQSKEMFDKARAAYQAIKAPLIKPSFTEKSVEELLVLVETR